MQITKGRQNVPYKVVIYGPEGIGKSTFAAQFPDPIFIDTEGSTARMDVARLPKPSSWVHLAEVVTYVIQNKPCKTLVIDTADWAQQLAVGYVISSGGEKIKSIEDFGYGKGYTMLAEQFGKLLNKLTEVCNAGINVVLTAHAWMRKFEQPDEMGAYDRWELKLERKVAPLIKEWADMVLFANYKTQIIEDPKTKTKKAFGGQRVMYTAHHPAWDAKNRDGLQEELPLEFKSIAHLFNSQKIEDPSHEPIVEIEKDQDHEYQEYQSMANEILESLKGTELEQEKEKAEYSVSLPQKVMDLLETTNATEFTLIQAIGPTTKGGRGYFPEGVLIDTIPEAFWDHVAANWDSEFKPTIQKILMEIPY